MHNFNMGAGERENEAFPATVMKLKKNRVGGHEDDSVDRAMVGILGFWEPFHPRGCARGCQSVCCVTHPCQSSSRTVALLMAQEASVTPAP